MYGDDATGDDHDKPAEEQKQPRNHYTHTGVHFIDASVHNPAPPDPADTTTEGHQHQHNHQHTGVLDSLTHVDVTPPSPEISSGNLVIKGAFVPGHGYMKSGDHTDAAATHRTQHIPEHALPPPQQISDGHTGHRGSVNGAEHDRMQMPKLQQSTSTTDIDQYSKPYQSAALPTLPPTPVKSAAPHSQTQQHQQHSSSNSINVNKPASLDRSHNSLTDSTGEPTFRAWVAESPDGKWARYDKKLGSGTFKEVYLSVDTESGKEVAWNIVDLRRLSGADVKRIRSETDLLTKLRHPHIIEIYDVFELPDLKQLCFITEKMSYTLKQHVANLHPAKVKVIKKYCRQILRALSYLHSFNPPIIHRDLKCDNIFIDGTTGDAKLGDFGLAIHQYSATSMIGTPGFMAPELFNDKYNELVDIWSFGMCVFEMATNEFPYMECNGVVSVLLRKGYEGILPANINKIKDVNMREFVKMCLQPAGSRPSAQQLLQNTVFDLSEPVPVVKVDITASAVDNAGNQSSLTESTNNDNNNNQQLVQSTPTPLPEPEKLVRETSGTGSVSDSTVRSQTAAALKLAEDEAHRLENKRRAEQLITKVDVVKTDNPAVVSISLHCLLPKPVMAATPAEISTLVTPVQSPSDIASATTPSTGTALHSSEVTSPRILAPGSLSTLEFEQKQILIPSYDFSKDNYITVATQLVKTMNELKALEIDHLEEYIAQRIETSTKRYYDKWSSKHRSTQNSEIMTLLSSLGINLSYAQKFIEQEVAIDDLFLLNDADLTEFLPKLGPRRRMQQYLDTEREKRKVASTATDSPAELTVAPPTVDTCNSQPTAATDAAAALQYHSDVPAADKGRRRKSSIDETEAERVAEREKRKQKQKQKQQLTDTVAPTNSDEDKKANKAAVVNSTSVPTKTSTKPVDVTIQPNPSPTSVAAPVAVARPVSVDIAPAVADENEADELREKRVKQKAKQVTQKRERQRLEKLMDEVKRKHTAKNGYEESEEQSDESHIEHNDSDTSDDSNSTNDSDDDIQSTAHMVSANLMLRKRLHKAKQNKRQLDNIAEDASEHIHPEHKHNLEHVGSMPDLNRQQTPVVNTGSAIVPLTHTTSAPVSPSHRPTHQHQQSNPQAGRPSLYVNTPNPRGQVITTTTSTGSPISNKPVQVGSVKPVAVNQAIRKLSDNIDGTTSSSTGTRTSSPVHRQLTAEQRQQIAKQTGTFLDNNDSGMNALLSRINTELGSKTNVASPSVQQPVSPRMHAQGRRHSDMMQPSAHPPLPLRSPYSTSAQPPLPASSQQRSQHTVYDTPASAQQAIPAQMFQSRAHSAIINNSSLTDLSLNRSLSQSTTHTMRQPGELAQDPRQFTRHISMDVNDTGAGSSGNKRSAG